MLTTVEFQFAVQHDLNACDITQSAFDKSQWRDVLYCI